MNGPIEKAVSKWVVENRRVIVWALALLLVFWVVSQIREVITMIASAYFIAVLIDPLVSRLACRGLSRGFSIILLCSFFFLLFAGLILLAVPAIVSEYGQLMKVFPGYLDSLYKFTSEQCESKLGIKLSLDEFLTQAKTYLGALDAGQLQRFGQAGLDAVLKGYSLTLTIVNFALLPFFVYYITKDLHPIHYSIYKSLPAGNRREIAAVAKKILGHVYAFFKGQFTVAFLMAFLYVVLLFFVGLNHSLLIGSVAGLLNIVPYLGVGLGVILASVISILEYGSLMHLLMVLGVFGVVQLIEGTVLTPKIVGESLGMHPLAVIVALIVGGQLFGLVGMILAIPGVASLKVLWEYLRKSIDTPVSE